MVVALWDRGRLAQDSGVELGSGYGGVTTSPPSLTALSSVSSTRST